MRRMKIYLDTSVIIAQARKSEILATTSASCAEMRMLRKIEYFVHFGETGDSPDTFKFYFQHNNYLDAPNSPDKMNDTLLLWERLVNNPPCDVVISEIFLKEIVDCPEPKRSFMLGQLNAIQYELVSRTSEVTQLAEQYVDYGVLSRNHYSDLLHIAHAAIYDCHSVLS
jgi:hypothetical protein